MARVLRRQFPNASSGAAAEECFDGLADGGDAGLPVGPAAGAPSSAQVSMIAGAIEVTSSPGTGTILRILLPLAAVG
jgi:hypothetical protein